MAVVRWAPGTYFNPHRHFGGEEIFVIDGVFEDEHGRYPEGTWLRSPHMSAHKPFSVEGCTIFVKTGHLLTAWHLPEIFSTPSVSWHFSKNGFEPQANRLTFSRAQWQHWVQNQRNRWENCNLQFSFNYTKYYTSAIFVYKLLIYIYFWRAWISVNP